MEFQGAARCGCDVTSLYPQTSRQNCRKALQQILQSLLQMMFAARAAKTAGVNRKSYVIQTPLTLLLMKGAIKCCVHEAEEIGLVDRVLSETAFLPQFQLQTGCEGEIDLVP